MKINVYLDDCRPGPLSSEWVIVRSAKSAMVLLKCGIVNDMSLDHDMGNNEPTGYELLLWMEENNIWPSGNISVHSANLSGATKMKLAIESHERRMVNCKFCYKLNDSLFCHLHQDTWVCEDCWDDRLKTTE